MTESKKHEKENKGKSKFQLDVFIKHAKKHLFMDVAIPLVAILILFVVVIVKVPYQAKESYTEFQDFPVEKNEVVPDMDKPMQERVCVENPAVIKVEDNPFSPYIEAFGLSNYKCKADFRVWNQETSSGKWTYRYVFNVGGKEVVTEPLTYEIPKLGSVTFKFEIPDCQKGDSVEGNYELISGPTIPKCEYQTVYPNKTVTRIEYVKREVKSERLITKYEPLWQKLLGYNKYEKV